MSISPTGTYMALGDADGAIHLLSQAEEDMPFNGFDGQSITWIDGPLAPPEIEWTDSTWVHCLIPLTVLMQYQSFELHRVPIL